MRKEDLPQRFAGAPRVWAVGGGKGGVGKSVVTSSLAAAIAGTGRRCAVIDVDLGGANLHTLLDAPRPRRTLSHFISGEVKSLAELMVPTSVPNLSLVSGRDALIEMANPKHAQKEKLFRHVRGLDVDDVLLDLGAGSAFNVLDGFLIAERALVVITPEPTAIENAEHFLKAAFYRSLRAVARQPEVKQAILRVREDRRLRAPSSAWELIGRVQRIDPLAAKLLAECAESFAPALVVNRVEDEEHRRVGEVLAARCRDRLGVSVACAGTLDDDPHVRESVARKRPVVQLFSRSPFSQQIEELARRLVREDWEAREPGDHAFPSPPASDREAPGPYLRRCRKHLGASLEQMAERTRIPCLDDIESERFESLPPEPYLRGLVLEYARELGVPELETLASRYLERYRR